MARHCQASHGYQAIRGWPGPSADGLGPRLAPNITDRVRKFGHQRFNAKLKKHYKSKA